MLWFFRYDFTGTLIVVPDVSVLSVPGAKAELSSRPKIGEQMDGIRGLKALGVRDLNYKLAFLSCSVNATTLRVRIQTFFCSSQIFLMNINFFFSIQKVIKFVFFVQLFNLILIKHSC